MDETTPQYIIELKKHIDNKIENHEPKYFKEFKGHIDKRLDKAEEKLDKVEETLDKHGKKLDMHFETIGALKVQVTGIDTRVKDIEKAMFVS